MTLRKGKNGGSNFWKRDLGSCISCEPFKPEFEDDNIWRSCWVEPKNNRRICAFGCKNGLQLLATVSELLEFTKNKPSISN